MPRLNFDILYGRSLRLRPGLWFELIGSAVDFSLESRIFHSISLGLIVLSSLYVPYNLYAGLYVGSLSAMIFAGFYGQQYYYSRFLGKPHSSTLFGLGAY